MVKLDTIILLDSQVLRTWSPCAETRGTTHSSHVTRCRTPAHESWPNLADKGSARNTCQLVNQSLQPSILHNSTKFKLNDYCKPFKNNKKSLSFENQINHLLCFLCKSALGGSCLRLCLHTGTQILCLDHKP